MLDLHLHTNLSHNSCCSVEEVLKKAQKKKLKKISICDNNTVLAHLLLQNIDFRRYYDGNIVVGAEFDVCEEGIAFSLLAYNFDLSAIQEWTVKKYGHVVDRQQKLYEQLVSLCNKKGFVLDLDVPFDPMKEYAHQYIFAQLMKHKENEKKFGEHVPRSYSEFYGIGTSAKEFPLYIDMKKSWPTLEEVVEVIHSNGGEVYLASPYQYRAGKFVDQLLDLCGNKIDGIEVYYPVHKPCQTEKLLRYAKEHNMKITGGSGFQGEKRFNKLMRIKPELLSI